MPKLIWSVEDERRYEAGVDRGVFYPVSGAGVAWNGLVSVNETPSGGESSPFYLDGIRYHNRPGSEEFGATLEAFTYPPQFEECDGTLELVDGLSAMHQRRKPFGLCYRTRIGTAANPNKGYKLHLIYNAMAEPADRNYQTLGDNADPTAFSWVLSAIPKTFDGAKPTAHLVIDSTRISESTMLALESLLYGTTITVPSLPEPEDLIDLITSGLPVGEFTITDNGDGTFTASGSDADVQSPIDGVFVLDSEFVTDHGDGTFTAVSG